MKKFQQDCGCAISINAGTEAGHVLEKFRYGLVTSYDNQNHSDSVSWSHWGGYKFQFRKNLCISNYVANSFMKEPETIHWVDRKNNTYD
ncbi:hypothetical protein FRC12_017402, partial [Ceratobasidium sp. 428]